MFDEKGNNIFVFVFANGIKVKTALLPVSQKKNQTLLFCTGLVGIEDVDCTIIVDVFFAKLSEKVNLLSFGT